MLWKKVAVIIGGSSGIGKSIATTLLDKSYHVLANGRTIDSAFKELDYLMLNNNDMLQMQFLNQFGCIG